MMFKKPKLERNILKQAIAATQRETGLKLILTQNTGLVIERYKYLHFTVSVKQWAQQANLGALINEIKQLPGNGMLVADYVNPKMAEKLRKMEVPFIDTAGNVYINEKPLYVFVKCQKNKTQNTIIQITEASRIRGRAFQPAGLKILYAFITNPKLVNAPYRDIVEITSVALGTVGVVINDLKQAGYLVEYNKKQRQLKNKNKLLDKWVDAYLEKLRPKLFYGTFATENEYWWRELNGGILKYDAKWGGEVAAAKLTGHLKPEKIILYLSNENTLKKLFSDNRFRQNPNGNIQIYRAFWSVNDKIEPNLTDTVDPLLVYADLLATGDPRNLETARILYDKQLAGFIRED